MDLRFFIFLLLFISNPVVSQINTLNSDVEIELSLKGKVKSFYKTTIFVYQDPESNSTNKERFRLNDIHLTFDQRGNLNTQFHYYADGNIKAINRFDSNGNKIEAQENNSQGKQSDRWLYVYNSDNKLTEIKKYDEQDDLEYRHLLTYKNGKVTKDVKYKNISDIISEKVYEYSTNGSLIGIKAFNSKAQINWEIQNKYDAKDRLITHTSINDKGRKNYYSVYAYDENDNRTQEIRYNLNDEIIFTHVYRYDNLHRKVEEMEFDAFNHLASKKNYYYHKKGYIEKKYDFTFKAKNEIDDVTTITFDKNKNIIEKMLTDAIGNVLKKQTFKYNSKNQLLSSSYSDFQNEYHHNMKYRFNLKGNISGGSNKTVQNDELTVEKYYYQYLYDKQGNWVKRIRIVDDKQTKIEERKLEYY